MQDFHQSAHHITMDLIVVTLLSLSDSSGFRLSGSEVVYSTCPETSRTCPETSRSISLLCRFASAVSSFQARLAAAKHVCVLTGAGVSAESGIPTFRYQYTYIHESIRSFGRRTHTRLHYFRAISVALTCFPLFFSWVLRGAGGLWRTYQSTDLATPSKCTSASVLSWIQW